MGWMHGIVKLSASTIVQHATAQIVSAMTYSKESAMAGNLDYMRIKTILVCGLLTLLNQYILSVLCTLF